MRRLKLGLALGALIALGVAGNTHAASTESTWTATGTGTKANGTKKAPKAFSGSWSLKATNNANASYRPATPSSWSWGWEGVVVRQKGLPSCTAEAINDAKTTAVCPPGTHLGTAPVLGAMFGPTGLAEGPNTDCSGKLYHIYNGPAGQLIMVIDGPPEQCATLGFLGAYPLTLATAGGRTTMTWTVPENLKAPLPGAEAALLGGEMVFNDISAKVKAGKKKKKVHLFNSIKCEGQRAFQYTVVDSFGTHVIDTDTGKCNTPPKKKGKKK